MKKITQTFEVKRMKRENALHSGENSSAQSNSEPIPFPHQAGSDLLGVVGDNPVLLPSSVSKVSAVCFKVDRFPYRGVKSDMRFRFYFRVFDPIKFEGVTLVMYVRDGGWRTLPVSSKLWKLARVATQNQIGRGRKVTKSLFVGKAFLCKVKTMKGPAPYTIIDTILEVLAG
jgi:hypothetical protein